MSKKELRLKRPKRINSDKLEKHGETQSIFMFSKISKKLMIKDDIELSSIGEDNKYVNYTPDINNGKKQIRREFASIQINNKTIKEKLKQKMNEDLKDENEKDINYVTASKVEVNSDKNSIISILSELM